MTDFEFDCKEKKRIASNARRMKNGSKSKKCSLSSDRMTEAQWKKRNGEVIVMNMGQPMSFEQFKGMPVDLQKEYINNMITRFGCNLSTLGKFFGLNAKDIKTLCENLEVDMSRFGRGLRMSAEQAASFNKWCGKEPEKATKPAKAVERTSNGVKVSMEPRENNVATELSGMHISQIAATFVGKLNMEQIKKFLTYATDGKSSHITITVGEVTDG